MSVEQTVQVDVTQCYPPRQFHPVDDDLLVWTRVRLSIGAFVVFLTQK